MSVAFSYWNRNSRLTYFAIDSEKPIKYDHKKIDGLEACTQGLVDRDTIEQ